MTELHAYKRVGKTARPAVDGVPLTISFSVVHNAHKACPYVDAVACRKGVMQFTCEISNVPAEILLDSGAGVGVVCRKSAEKA